MVSATAVDALPPPAGAPRRWRSITGPGLVLIGWWALVGLTILLRHVHAVVAPIGTDYEVPPAVRLGGTDLQSLVIGLLIGVPLAVWWWRDRDHGRRDPTMIVDAPPRWVVVAVVTAGTAALVLMMLLRPLPERLDCASRIIRVGPHLGFVWNCDSSQFQHLAAHPSGLLQPGQPRQSRPVYVLIGALLYQTIGRVVGLVGLGQWHGVDTRSFVALDVLNVAVLVLAGYLMIRLLLQFGTGRVLAAALTVPLVFNTLTIAWTWTPHQQTFAMLMPVATVLVVRQALVRPPPWRQAAAWGAGIGLASLAYGSWLITVGAVAVALVIARRRRGLAPAAAAVGGSLVPVLGWMLICILVTGRYYNLEVASYREFVWVLDAARAGPGDLLRHAWAYLLLAVRSVLGCLELWFAAGAIAIGVLVASTAGVQLRPSLRGIRREPSRGRQSAIVAPFSPPGGYFVPRSADNAATFTDRSLLTAIGITLSVSAAFLWAVGFYTPRLSICLLPPLLILAGWVYARIAALGPRLHRLVTALAVLVAAGWIALLLYPPLLAALPGV